MHIDIHDPVLESRIQRQVQAAGGNIEEAIDRLLRTQEELDRWLSEDRANINDKIRRGLEQLSLGEGIPGDVARAQMQERKAAWLRRSSSERH